MSVTSVTASSVAPPVAKASTRNAELEGVRAIAALAVLVTHVSLNAMGNRGPFGGLLARLDVGVAVFFVVSGYLLYRPFAAALLRGDDRPSTRRYLRHRLVRIIPAYWVVVVASFLFVATSGLVLPTTNFNPAPSGLTSVPLWTMARFLTFTQVYWGDSLAGPFPQAWTLAVEMSFYLVLPVLAFALGRRAPGSRAARLRRQWSLLGAMVVLAQVFRLGIVLFDPAYRGDIGLAYTQYKAWLPNHLDLFALGMGMAVISVERDDGGPGSALGRGLDRMFARRWAAGMSVLVALGALCLAGYGLGLSRTDLSYHRVGEFARHWAYGVVALGLILPAVFGRTGKGWFRGFLASRPMQFLGKISYGIYLWQILVIGRWVSAPSYTGGEPGAARHPGGQFNVAFWPTLAWTLTVTIGLATATWYLVERPWLRVRDRKLGPFARGMWIIGLTSFASRIWAISTVTAGNAGNGDPFYYHAQANMLADGVGFGEPIQWLTEGRFVPTAIHPPLFTLWLTPASLLGARGFLTHKTMAALAGVAVVVVAGFLARRFAGDRAGLIAAGLVAIYPNLWLIDGTLWPEGLYTAAVGLALLAAYRWRDSPSFGWAALVGVAVGAAVLARGEALLLLPFLCLPMVWSQRGRVARWAVHGVVMGAVALGVMAPWLVRNAVEFHRPVLSTNSEEVLYYANCPDTYSGQFIGYWSFNCQERARAEREAQGLPRDPPGDEAERASAWGALGRQYAADNKERLPYVVAARVSRVWDLRYAENNARVVAIEGRPVSWAKRGLWLYRLLAIPGLIGLWIIHRRRDREAWPLVAMLAMITTTAVYAYGHIRFRTVGDLVLLVGAAVALEALISRWRSPPDPNPAPDPDVLPHNSESATIPTNTAKTVVSPARRSLASRRMRGRPSWASLRPEWRTVLTVAVVGLVFGLPLRALFRYQGPPMEEGFMLVFPEQILNGRVPHKDFLHLYGPGSLWALAGWYKLLGVSITAERIFGMVQLGAIVAGVMALARPWGRQVMAAAGLVGALLTVTAIGLTALAWDGAVAFLVASLWVGLRARRWITDAPGVVPRDAYRRAGTLAFIAGGLAGLGLLFRPDTIVAVVISALAVGSGLKWVVRRRWIAGVVVGLTPYLVLFAMAGPGTALEGMLIQPVFKLRGGRSLPQPPSWSQFDGALQKVASLREPGWPLPSLASPNQAFIWFFLLPAVVAFIVGVGWWRVRVEPEQWKPRVLLAVGLLGLGLMPQALQRPDSTHLAWVSCVPLAFLPAAIAELLGHVPFRLVRRRATTLAAGSVLLIPLLVIPHFTTRTWVDLVKQGKQDQVFGWPISQGERRFYLGSPTIAVAAQQMLDEVAPQTRPGQRLFVGTADLRKTPYSDAYLYFLLPELTPATRYIEMDPGMANAEDSGLAEEVASSDWLILSHIWQGWVEPNDSRVFGPNEPNLVVQDNFCRFGSYAGPPDEFGKIQVYFDVYRRCVKP